MNTEANVQEFLLIMGSVTLCLLILISSLILLREK